ncbi:hypothetical protein MW887_003430 [Aspergillus wentii]|nr:hypothetical protein MW887_003430 [Aspergillus wentii]
MQAITAIKRAFIKDDTPHQVYFTEKPQDVQPRSSIDAEAEAVGIAKIEAIESIWSRKGRYLVYAGLAMIMIIYELDNSTVGTYRNYATSAFNQLSMLATLNTAASIITGVCKPPIAKMSDVVGRAETYIFTISCFILSYILCASSKDFNTYAGGYVFYSIGQGGTSMLNSVIVSDFSSMRWRGFSYNLLYLPFLIIPWVSAFIIDSVVNGIGWRWGIGMFAILMPFCASFIIITLLIFQHRAKRSGVVLTERLNLVTFFSRIDLGGVILLSGGFALLLIPITIAATTTSRWRTPWVDVLIALGAICLLCLYPYEKYFAKYPVVPARYFRTLSVVIPVSLSCIDNISFGATHTYLYAWSIVSHNFSPRDAQFLTYTNGVAQCLVGMLSGLLMYRFRSYKWIGVVGAIVRLVGYGVMVRLRSNDSSTAELFIVQLVQGVGSGVIETVNIVAAQIVVPHDELAQVTSLVMLGALLGNGIGSAIAGGIYTEELRNRLRFRMGSGVSEKEVNTVYDSITGGLPAWGTAERTAVNQAYSDVMGYITIAALAISVPIVILALFMPDNKLGDRHNLEEECSMSSESFEDSELDETK